MGKSGWRYFVPFQEDVQAALDDLRGDVFRRRDYHAPGRRAKKATTIAEAVELFAAERPTRTQVEAGLGALPFSTCFYLVVYDEAGHPRELCFTGSSGD